MPWLVVPGHCVSLHDAAIHRVVLPEDDCAAACRGSFGDWLALVPPESGRPYLLNAFTMARIKLPLWTGEPIDKIILSSAPDTESGYAVAAVVHHGHDYRYKAKIIVCRLGGGPGGSTWWPITDLFCLQDVIFFEGKLHALDGDGRVHAFEDAELERLRNERPMEGARGGHNGATIPSCTWSPSMGRSCAWCFGDTCVPGGTYYTCAVGVFALPLPEKRPAPINDFNGHAVFVGDACCGAFSVAAAGGKIRENQICFVDDEKNLAPLSLPMSGQRDARRPLRALQSYDPRHRCVRTYQPRDPSPAAGQPWWCVAAQRFPRSHTMGPPPRTTQSGPELLLCNVLNCLGSSTSLMSYSTEPEGHGTAVTVHVFVPKSRSYDNHTWSFTQRRQSTREAKQAAAHEALTFLRSRFRAVLDDSPWSSIPYFHGGVEERAEEEKEEDEHAQDSSGDD
ncbi:LOW QUALITY PROTEIN: hypothetical protein BRADI_5g10916v3 [Brachypodium distachyon]|uniref:KIB1-4 beta-propeller domain-containing protein n=1 Tax=Brachypodium distachyon TaxID=15368 RepID=A0A2K2CGJ6_BRADI|nr:LOW QUALITY PROTEIN: hypothetical protein BRADI_5g10916v3 [Brachypodium distachyon]